MQSNSLRMTVRWRYDKIIASDITLSKVVDEADGPSVIFDTSIPQFSSNPIVRPLNIGIEGKLQDEEGNFMSRDDVCRGYSTNSVIFEWNQVQSATSPILQKVDSSRYSNSNKELKSALPSPVSDNLRSQISKSGYKSLSRYSKSLRG